MQEQADEDVLPVQARKPARCLVGLLLIQVHSAHNQLHCILRQQIPPARKIPARQVLPCIATPYPFQSMVDSATCLQLDIMAVHHNALHARHKDTTGRYHEWSVSPHWLSIIAVGL